MGHKQFTKVERFL